MQLLLSVYVSFSAKPDIKFYVTPSLVTFLWKISVHRNGKIAVHWRKALNRKSASTVLGGSLSPWTKSGVGNACNALCWINRLIRKPTVLKLTFEILREAFAN